jgi:hypothetical protein
MSAADTSCRDKTTKSRISKVALMISMMVTGGKIII